jgi:hypothetical protein
MKSLDEYNEEKRKGYSIREASVPKPNGIACPECGKEMLDSEPGITLMSYPPKTRVHCPSCPYKGHRIV